MSETPHHDIERDAGLTALYRATAQDAPPAALDEAIRAAARRAAGTRPRPAGFSFGHAWRMPLSIAAVMVLSVSIVILMREEAPELTAPPRAEMPDGDAKRKTIADAGESTVATTPGFVPDPQRSKSIGLKPPPATPLPALGMRQPGSAEPGAQSFNETMANRSESDAAVPSSAPAKRRDAFANSVEQRDARVAASAEQSRQAAKPAAPQEAPQSPAAEPAPAVTTPAPSPAAVAGAVAERKAQLQSEAATADPVERESRMRAQSSPAPAPAVPAAKPAMAQAKSGMQAKGDTGKLEGFADLPPEKWLERIEALRKQGKIDEAKASLAAFRKRHPDYRLPDSLRGWAGQ